MDFWDCVKHVWADGFLGQGVVVLLFLAIAFAIVLVVGLVFSFIDSIGIACVSGQSVVKKKSFERHSAQTTMILVGKVLVPQTRPAYTSYYIHLRTEGEDIVTSVQQETYEMLSEGQDVTVIYGRGRFSKAIIVQSIVPR